MSENTGEISKQENNKGRRAFLKKAALIGGAVALGGAGINLLESKAVENGISSDSGTFFPLYETHYKGLDVDKIPNDLDVLFKEGGVGNWTFMESASSEEVLVAMNSQAEATAYDGKPMVILPTSTLERVSRNGTEIMLGDSRTLSGDSNFIRKVGHVVEFTAGVIIGLTSLREGLSKTKKMDSGKSNITRRTLLKSAGLLSATWLMAPITYAISRGGRKIGEFNTERDNALNRIIDRLYGLSSNTHPEDLLVFFRNVLMADKMLAVAEDIEQKTGKKAKIGFNVEYGHNGIEDFLRVGHDVCRWIIAQYPKPVLQAIADVNGGSESLWAARLFKLPKDFFEQDPEKRWDNVGDRKVIDVELKEVLEKKLA